MLINKTHVRSYIKDRFKNTRPHLGIDRVSEQALTDIEAHIMARINKAVAKYPTRGMTFMYCE